MIYPQVAIRNYAGKGVTLLSAYDNKRGLLAFTKSMPWQAKRERDDAILIVDTTDVEDRDFLFQEEYLQESVRLYFDMQSSGKLIIKDNMRRFDAQGQIEVDSIKEKGRLFRFSPSISNEHIAALATVYYIQKSRADNDAIELASELSKSFSDQLLSGSAISI